MPNAFAQNIARWKHLAALTQEEQETVLSRSVVERARRQIGLFTSLFVDRLDRHHWSHHLYHDGLTRKIDRDIEADWSTR